MRRTILGWLLLAVSAERLLNVYLLTRHPSIFEQVDWRAPLAVGLLAGIAGTALLLRVRTGGRARKPPLALLTLALGIAGWMPADAETVTLAQFKPRDPASEAQLLATFTARTGVRVRQRTLPNASDVQHQQFVTWLAARDSGVDVYQIDQIWTAEFAAAGWIRPAGAELTAGERAAFLRAPLASAAWGGRLWALPRFTESGLLYYRRDVLPAPPRSWPELVRVATALGTTGRSGYVFQGKQYEGLVVNFLEILWAMGGRLLGEDGGVAVDSPAGVRAIEILAALLRHPGAASPGVLTYAEHDSLQEFLEGRALMHRNWSFAWSLVEREGSRVRGRVGVAPLPGPASLGGWHLAVSAYSRHPAAAWALARFLTSAEAQRVKALVEGRLPTVGALYDDREVLRANPHFAALRDALALARPRPPTPFYARLSGILQVQISRALVGAVSPREALAEATRQMAPLAGARSAGLPR